MTRTTRATLRNQTRPLLALACLIVCSGALAGGPPTLGVEALAADSPEAVRGFAFAIAATQCGMTCKAPVVARAEGLVDGKRITRDVLVVPVRGQDGRWLVKRTWPAEGTWALVFSINNHGKATAVVRIEPARPAGAGTADPYVQVVHRVVSPVEIDALLRTARPLAG